MNINQLLVITILLFIYIDYHNKTIYEDFEGEITRDSCIQRILNYECLSPEKSELLNNQCGDYTVPLPSGIVNVRCDEKVLFDTLLCQKMLSEGACECSYGRKQIQGLCNIDPINISCPIELQTKDLAIIERIESLQEESEKCENVIQKEKELFSIAKSLKDIMIKGGIIKESDNMLYWIIPLLFIMGSGFIYYIYQNKKK